ncbi:hypothetical protein [Lysobacter soli]|uniref:Tetratricopeptide repeat protein n=1 Tax=Lysobacter soli TaxID=453783 RepID=A0A3D8VJX0_9GAMM|nr:hypothetical protein [Lysobacter soli]RDY69657.1 hypothetical protein DX912_02640 [Lysobacter soli]
MDRIGERRTTHAERMRAVRWRFGAATVLLLAACARWPLSAVSNKDAPQPVPDAAHGGSELPSGAMAAGADRNDVLRTRATASRDPGASHRAAPRASIGASRRHAVPRVGAGRGREETVQRSASDVDSETSALTRGNRELSPEIVGGSVLTEVAPDAVAPPSEMAVPAAAGTEIRNTALHPVGAPAVADPRDEADAFQENNQQVWRWLAVMPATVLLLLIARRRMRPRRVRKMNTQRAELTGPRPSMPAPTSREAEKARVRMFSAREIYAPTHESHRGPWEAPVTTERGFAHRYEVDAHVGDGLLFVPGFEAHSFDAQVPSRAGEAVADPAALIAPMTTRPATMNVEDAHASVLPHAVLPLVFAVVAEPPAEAARQNDASFDRHVSRNTPGLRDTAPAPAMASPEAMAPAVAKMAEQGTVSDARVASATTAPASARPLEKDAKLASPQRAETTRSSGTTVLDPAEFFSNVARVPVAGVSDVAPAVTKPYAQPTVTQRPTAPQHDPVGEARRLVEAGDHLAALKHLEVAMQSAHPQDDVWMLAALCWWHVARADGSPKAYAKAADAIDRLLERDPSRAELWYRTGSCRLLQASGERGAAQRATLDLAVAALQRATVEGGRVDPLRTETLGDALFERAVAATDEHLVGRAQRMGEAVQVLRDAARSLRAPASPAAWKLQQALQAQASLLSGTEASRLRMEADAVLAAGAESATAQERVAWVAAKAENELAHAELAEGATRTLHLRAFRDNHRDLLTGPDASPELLLSWLELLALETAHLRGDAARSRFDEGEAILKRLDDLLPNDAHVALARARLLHRRAAQSSGSVRHAVLSEAIAGLMPMVERGDAPHLQIEVAELLLDRAAGASTTQAVGEYAGAETMAAGLLDHPVFAMAAARCVLQARLGQSSGTVEPRLCQQLEALAGDDVRARWLLAQAALRNGAPREACGHCEAAARSGMRLDQAFMQLWDQASRQWSATLHNPKDPAWMSNRQRLRSAT